MVQQNLNSTAWKNPEPEANKCTPEPDQIRTFLYILIDKGAGIAAACLYKVLETMGSQGLVVIIGLGGRGGLQIIAAVD